MSATKPVLVASDVHYGAIRPERERSFLAWLDHAAESASAIVINGDLFDFWFEFRTGIPRGYDALLGRLKEIVTDGVPITLTGGNHDWWGGAYLREEVGGASNSELQQLLAERYADEPFVHVLPEGAPEMLQAGYLNATGCNGTNDLQLMVFGNDQQVLLVARYDNLGKGAAGAAVQNLNLMLGIDERTGL